MSSLPSSYSVENYRCFPKRQHIQIRPLTLFYGRNSSGKSALLRFLPLLAESIRTEGPPVWLGGEVGRSATWPDLVCRTTKRDVLRFVMEWLPNEAHRPIHVTKAEWEITGDPEARWQEVEEVRIATDSTNYILNTQQWGNWAASSDDFSAQDDARAISVLLKGRLRDLASNVQWLSGVRIRPRRVDSYATGAPLSLRSDGENALHHLVAAQSRTMADPLLREVQTFFHELGQQLLIHSPTKGFWSALLSPLKAPSVQVNLCDTGEGYQQVLPVLIALARACLGGPRLLCMEQPELHLHTHAQRALAKVLVQSANHPSEPRILVETHSEVLLMSLQLAIAKGEIPAEKVRVYWVESRDDGTSDSVAVDFDELGHPKTTTMMHAFDDVFVLSRELNNLQLSKLAP